MGTQSTKKAGATESGSDDAVNCSTHDDCSDLYPEQLDDNWLAVTDDKKPKKKTQVNAVASGTDDTTKTNEWHHHAHSTTWSRMRTAPRSTRARAGSACRT